MGDLRGKPHMDQAKVQTWMLDETEMSRSIPPSGRKLLEQYSQIPSNQVVPHVVSLQKKALAIAPYPYISRLRFLRLQHKMHPQYQVIVKRINHGETYLDLGCGFAQDIRALAHSGVSMQNVIGIELDPAFIALGYELFRDRDRLDAQFLSADIFNDADPIWVELYESASVVHASSFFHLWNYPTQLVASKAAAKLLKPNSGSMVIGEQLGSLEAGEYRLMSPKETMYCHSATSMTELWDRAGREMGKKFNVSVVMGPVGVEMETGPLADPKFKTLFFTVTLVEP